MKGQFILIDTHRTKKPFLLEDHFYIDPRTKTLVPFQRLKPDLIVEHLYLGDIKDAYDQKTIARYGITHVLSVMLIDDLYQHLSKFSPDIKVDFIPVLDQIDVNIKQYFERSISFIEQGIKSGGSILVHCFWGMSRSATIVMAYVMHRYQMDFPTAYNLVRSARPIASPNDGFIRQLIEFGNELASVEFVIHYQTKYGENLHLVGEISDLGNWQPTPDNQMDWIGGGLWRINKPLLRKTTQYKYVVVDQNGHVIWETGPNHLFDGTKRFVRDCWGV